MFDSNFVRSLPIGWKECVLYSGRLLRIMIAVGRQCGTRSQCVYVQLKHFKGNFYSSKKHFLCIENAIIKCLEIDKTNFYSCFIGIEQLLVLCTRHLSYAHETLLVVFYPIQLIIASHCCLWLNMGY